MAALQFSEIAQPNAADDEKKEMIYANDSADGFDTTLFRSMVAANKGAANIVFSPFSVLGAMSICMVGAANNMLKKIMCFISSS